LQVLKPRSDEQAQQREKVPQTLSLTAIDDPITLANAMVNVYSSNSMYTSRIKETNKTACQILLKMDVAKQCVEASNWARALDVRMSLRGVE
jgi:nuclear pore complex protein Nup93